MISVDLTGQVALVTGAARGIGQSISLRLGRAGAAVIAVDLVDPTETVKALRRVGASVEGLVADVARRSDTVTVVERALTRFGRLDILVNNAGVVERKRLSELDDETPATWAASSPARR